MVFPKPNKFIIIVVSVVFALAILRGYQLYRYIYAPNVKNQYILFVYPGFTYDQVFYELQKSNVLSNYKAFKWVLKKKGLPVKTGRYMLKTGMTTNQLVNKLNAGFQDPLNVTFNNVRTKEELAGKISKYLITDSISILGLFSNDSLINHLGFTKTTFQTMFLPDTYELYWTTSAYDFAARMKTEYDHFWNENRSRKAKILNLSLPEITTLASIVQAETVKKDEQPRIAGLYLNRLSRGILLQADPTVKYAIGDFTLKRILNVHLQTDSPYNTYKYVGLPPGPINFPETSTIDAVLNAEKHNYLYMCAKEDFSGYHNFAVSFEEHSRNAAKYRTALNKMGVR